MSSSLARGLGVMRGIQELYLNASEPHVFARNACELLARTSGLSRVDFSVRTASGSRYEVAWSRAGSDAGRPFAFAIQTGNSSGVLTVVIDEADVLDEHARNDLQGIATAIARSVEMLERRRSDAAGARRLRRMRERLDAISRSIGRSPADMAQVQNDVLHDVLEDLGMEAAYLGYVDDRNEAQFVHVYPESLREVEVPSVPVDGTLIGWMLERGEDAVGLTSLLQDPRFRRFDHLHHQGTTTFAGAAFPLDDQQWFVALGGSKDRPPFEPDELDYVRTVASYFRMSCLQERVNKLQFFDDATGLPNQTMLSRRMEELIAREPRRSFFVLAIAIDDFWPIARTRGAREADALLKDLGSALQSAARENVVFRGKGETFRVLCPAIDDDLGADELGEKLASAAESVMSRFGTSSVSIGAAAYKRDGSSFEEIEMALRDAVEEARTDDRRDLIFRSLSTDSVVGHRRSMRRELEHALSNEEFVLHYQPYVDLHRGSIVGAEALLRWDSPARGFVQPDDFIPVAEQIGLIDEIGSWVMHRALHDATQWQRFGDLDVAVNVSAKQVGPQLVTLIQDAAAAARFDLNRLVVEITESTAMNNRDVVGVLHRLHALGVRIAIDDFGTGYSSLAYLKQLPVDVVKLDRAFVEGLPYDPFDAAIASAVIAMGTRFGSVILAEGVETEEQLQWLRHGGCSLAQGFLIARPMPVEDLTRLLTTDVA